MGLASRVLLRETAACASPCDRSIDCCEIGRTRHARYKMAGILRIQAPAEVAHSHGMYRRPSTKRRAPGSWCDWGGLSHSGDPHTTMYRLTLPSVEHAGCAGLHTRQSRTGLATEETAAIRAMVQAQAHAASTQQRLGGRIFRAARSADGRWIARRAADFRADVPHRNRDHRAYGAVRHVHSFFPYYNVTDARTAGRV